MIQTRIAGLLFICGVILSSCYSPTFTLDVSQSDLTKRELSYLHTVSTRRLTAGVADLLYWAVPITRPGGFIGTNIEGFSSLYYLENVSLHGPIRNPNRIPTLRGFDFAHGMVFGNLFAAPKLLLYFPGMEESLGENMHLFSYNTTARSVQGPEESERFLADIAHPLFFDARGILLNDLHLLGIQLRASTIPTRVFIDAVVIQRSMNRLFELSFSMDEAGVVNFSSNINAPNEFLGLTDTVLRDLPVRGRYFYNPSSSFRYLQVNQDGRYRTFSLDRQPREVSFRGRIVSFLTSREILTIDDGYGLVYDEAGTRLFQFGLGHLSFMYEIYLNGVPNLIFMEPIDQRDAGGALFLQSFTLLTSQLNRLRNQ